MEVFLNIKRLRGRLAEDKVTNRKFAAEAGISAWTMGMILNGKYPPAFLTRKRIAEAAAARGWHDTFTETSIVQHVRATR